MARLVATPLETRMFFHNRESPFLHVLNREIQRRRRRTAMRSCILLSLLPSFMEKVCSFQFWLRPLSNGASHFDEHIFFTLAGSFEYPESMLGGVQRVERRALTEFFAYGLKQFRVLASCVASSAQEEHRDGDGIEMFRSLCFRLAWLM